MRTSRIVGHMALFTVLDVRRRIARERAPAAVTETVRLLA